jgi:perosamine synthetase
LKGEPDGCRSNYWLQTLLLAENVAGQRDAVLAATNDAGLMTRPIWKLMHRLSAFQDCPRAPLTVAESLEQRVINIPSSAFLG